jgi:hypothetical protein
LIIYRLRVLLAADGWLAGGPLGASLGIGHVGEVFGNVEGQCIEIEMPVPQRRPGCAVGTDRLHPVRHVSNAAGCNATTAVSVER